MARDYIQKKLKGILELADDEGFLQLVWATNALQSGAPDAAFRFLDPSSVSKDAITDKISSPFAIHEWELETLANELLTTPKQKHVKNGRERFLNITNYNVIVKAINYLRKLEEVEYKIGPNTGSIFMEMIRIKNRQFDWQRGFFNVPQFYRNAFIYGQGPCASYFESQNGITVNQLSLVGFGLYSGFLTNPVLGTNIDLKPIGVSPQDAAKAVRLLTLPIADARAAARAERRDIFHTAYRPSVFRMKPCISFGPQNERKRAPLPQLILEKVTSGVFYNVVGGGGSVRKDYGKRFEEYCLSYLRTSLPKLGWLKERRYGHKSNGFDTPDILCEVNEKLHLVIECKATRMSYGAKFGSDSLNDRGVDDLVTAVFQLWRFFSHCRRGLSTYTIDRDATGAVLTLDSWFGMANPLQERVMADATEMASTKDPLILEEDRRPIAFVAITDLERTVSRASEQSFLRSIRTAATDKYAGWLLDSVYEDTNEEFLPARPYPFRELIGQVLPWWDALEKCKKTAA